MTIKSFIAKRLTPTLSLIDPLSLKDAGSVPADSFTKIGTNNGLRSMLRATVAHFSLTSPDASVRLEAVREMSKTLDDRRWRCCERLGWTNSSVKKNRDGLGLAVGRFDLALWAVATLSHSVSQGVRNRLALLADKSPDGSFAESERGGAAPPR